MKREIEQLFTNKAAICVICLSIIIFLLLFSDSQINQALRYSTVDIESGQLWRMFSAHLIHLNVAHGLMNLVAFIIIILLVGNLLSLTRWVWVFFILSSLISLSLFLFSPDILWYVGLSGVLHGFLTLGLVRGSIAGDKLHFLALCFLVVKIVREQLPLFDVNHFQQIIGGAVVVDAHLYGALSGLVLAGFFYFQDKRYPSRTKNSERDTLR